MKFVCVCGSVIHDNSDFLACKAHLIPDKKWGEFWNDIDDAIEKTDPSQKAKEAACMRLRTSDYARVVYACSDCGRIYINDSNGHLHGYRPEGETINLTILDNDG